MEVSSLPQAYVLVVSLYQLPVKRPLYFSSRRLLQSFPSLRHNLANTVCTVPLISTSVLLFLTQASMPLLPFSTPTPLCFQPPTLISAGLSPHVLIHVMPAWSCETTLCAILMSFPNTPAASPSSVALARLIASSIDEYSRMQRTGPKISSLMIFMSSVQSVKIVGLA